MSQILVRWTERDVITVKNQSQRGVKNFPTFESDCNSLLRRRYESIRLARDIRRRDGRVLARNG
jgi:hypothetical protein